MVKQVIKKLLGEKNTDRIRRLKTSIDAAKSTWHNLSTPQSTRDRLNLSQLMSVHMLEKAMVVGNTKYLSAVKYPALIDSVTRLIDMGVPPDDYTVSESIAVIRSALAALPGHEDAKSQLEALVAKYSIPQNFRGGMEVIPSTEILSHTNFDFHAFVSSRRSVRKFKDKIISREVIYDIVRDALYCPSACNRQPFKVYFSEEREKIAKIIKATPDQFITSGFHDCLIVTCDRVLLSPAELDDQEYINGGIFLGYLVLSIHAHGLGSCLCQFLQKDRRQEKVKRSFGISDSEVIVCFVGIGELEDEVSFACSQRRPVETVAISLDS
ncbi:MAG: nitroreductase [Synergistaceae bacterium]|nr:nitroreductase [Synergistaceae bacterium]MBQ4402301.1 nitroreductase [Synergistaceae bacterium]MBQ6114835.1 nitroreductase [Synergistaceae bacterium]